MGTRGSRGGADRPAAGGGQAVLVEGALDTSGHFKADSVLAKHDETYMPKEVADALKKQGHWKSEGGGYGVAGSGAAGAKKQ